MIHGYFRNSEENNSTAFLFLSLRKFTNHVIAWLALSFVFAIPSLAQVPTIVSFTPTSGVVGTSVTITGTNFSATPANDIVYFGATRATVSTADSTSLTVTVPSGAAYGPITVTTNGLTAGSVSPFIPTFSNGDYLDGFSIEGKFDLTTSSGPSGLAEGDLDGDGKPDLVVANYYSNTISIYRNTGTSGSFTSGSFALKFDLPTDPNPTGVAIADLDGDGKLDIIVVTSGSNEVSVYHNISSPGSLNSGSFASFIDFSTGSLPNSVAIGDIDGDGKPDIVVTNGSSNTVSVLRNESAIGSITSASFDLPITFATGTSPVGLALGDIDGDGKVDIVTANGGGNSISIFRNIATPGPITSGSLAGKVDFPTGSSPYDVVIGDLDGDGKQDIVVSNNSSNTISIFRNTSTPGIIASGSLAGKVDFPSGASPRALAIGDMDGEGRPDIVVTNDLNYTISVFDNHTTMGSITTGSFGARLDFTTGPRPYNGLVIGDMDGDGKPDIAASDLNGNTISLFHNRVSPPPLMAISPDSFAVTLRQSDTTSRVLTIGNNGSGNLYWNVGIGNFSSSSSSQVKVVAERMRSQATQPASSAAILKPDESTAKSKLAAMQSIPATWSKDQTVQVLQSANETGSLPDIAIVAADDSFSTADVASKLLATGQFNTVTVIDGRSVTPTLSQLLTFKTVLVWSNYCFANNATLGNNLADYIDAGGGVVTAMISNYLPEYCQGIGGRFDVGNYRVLTTGYYTSTPAESMGTIYYPDNSIMQGVASFKGGSSSYRSQSSIVPGAIRIADWSDGSPLVAERYVNGHIRVDLGFYPPSQTYGLIYGNQAPMGQRLWRTH
ncbi:MAG: FG-GAP-like repeat-containing protein [Bacteroidota bacterium]